MTGKEVLAMIAKHKYVLLRHNNGWKAGVNCKAMLFPENIKKIRAKLDKPTNYQSFTPCSFNEYITHKIPFC